MHALSFHREKSHHGQNNYVTWTLIWPLTIVHGVDEAIDLHGVDNLFFSLTLKQMPTLCALSISLAHTLSISPS